LIVADFRLQQLRPCADEDLRELLADVTNSDIWTSNRGFTEWTTDFGLQLSQISLRRLIRATPAINSHRIPNSRRVSVLCP